MNNTKKEHQLSDEIVKTTTIIDEKFPELSKYTEEMPVTIPDANDPEISKETLKEYADSLDELVKKYKVTHNE